MALLLLFRTIIIIAGKSHIHGHKENRLELFKSRRHFGEINQPKTLNQPQEKQEQKHEKQEQKHEHLYQSINQSIKA